MDVLCVIAIPLAWKEVEKNNEKDKSYQKEAVIAFFVHEWCQKR